MSDKKSNVSDKASEIAKNIWLAGVGAYGKAADDAQERLEKAGVGTPKLFKELVKAGTALEEGAKGALKPSKRGSKSSVEERINKVRENFNLQRLGRSDELTELLGKVDLISKKLDLLTTALTESGAITVQEPTKKAVRRKTTKTKPAAKKAAAKKPAAKKPAAKKPPTKKKIATRKKRI